ncbi:hypothetical protein SAMD00019534_045740 [Acytostelium subglobosum LB1]|uniref:hypothetical protein n=1 Tax=Acytostelium subglobosum LB1 TaxID=1410327 RepID=UPI000644AE0C|nr:hypothetical protein SAMD00019534_045740 [Acytostelium subglobosum LB1]GAM21399.1 hypothetical protein SAMD00019534_045740 [Acytostelium subglobosum LB1]|eukprot:XP_012755518.1 hypothetical protein SAMD00019534_045740 [Acytostelium subglobosum LB1]
MNHTSTTTTTSSPNNTNNNNSHTSPEVVQFTSGRGSHIRVSDEAVIKAKTLINSIKDDEYDGWLKKRNRDDDDVIDDDDVDDDDGLVHYDNNNNDNDNGKKNKFDSKCKSQFTTGRGDQIRIESSNLNQAKSTIDVLDVNVDNYQEDLMLLSQPFKKE